MANLSQLILSGKDMVQSPYLVLDAAGSDASDGSARGVHLRWDLLGGLGDAHIPKGNLGVAGPYLANGGYNKPDDYVRLYRIPYKRKFIAEVDLTKDKPASTVESGTQRYWEFAKDITAIEHTDVSTTIIVRFTDTYKYDRARASYDPSVNPTGFMKAYNGIVEVEASGKLSFVFSLVVKQDAPAAGLTRIETISVAENVEDSDRYISLRRKFAFNSADRQPKPADLPVVDDTVFMQALCFDEYELMAQNIRYVRFDYQNVAPVRIKIETYADFIVGSSGLSAPWESVGPNDGKFALSVDDAEVFTRLENKGVYDIDGLWPRFYPSNAPDPLGGPSAFKVKVDNYKAKWTNTGGIKEGVITYLLNSRDGSPGIVPVQETMDVNADDDLQGTSMGINFLDMIKLTSFDYHIARMLGLGHIDAVGYTSQTLNTKYIYLAVYTTYGPLEAAPSFEERDHYYMTLPVGQTDNKKPLKPQAGLTFGLRYDEGVEEPILLGDENGYFPDQRMRFINVTVQQQELNISLEPFFFRDNNINFSFNSEPVLYGLEYRGRKFSNENEWEDYYRVPKLISDPVFTDHKGNPEVVPLMSRETPVIYTHQEREEGWHQYAVYALNWFSRYSDLSDPVQTETHFTDTCRLIPPLKLTGQLIQEEDTLLFTTATEQEKLHKLITDHVTDPTLVRVTFEINNVHLLNHQVANKVEFFYRLNEPSRIAGLISAVPQELAGKRSLVKTGPFTIVSDGSGRVVDPVITAADVQKYKGGIFSTTTQQFPIEDISPDPSNNNRALVKVAQLQVNQAAENPPGSNMIVPVQTFIAPQNGDKFFIVENLQNQDNWGAPLSKEVDIINLSPAIVTVSGSSGNNNTYTCITAVHAGRNTKVYVQQNIPSSAAGGKLSFIRKVAGVNMDVAAKTIVVQGNIKSDITPGLQITLGESYGADGVYTVASVQGGDNTTITLNEALPALRTRFSITYAKQADILAADQAGKFFTVQGDVVKEFQLAYTEVEYTSDGNPSIEHYGGLYASATITAIPDTTAATQFSGVYRIVFDSSVNFADHPDADVEWYHGSIRIPVTDPNSREKKTLEVIDIVRDNSSVATEVGPIHSPLTLLAYDATANDATRPKVLDGISDSRTVNVNFHPGYRVYLRAQNNLVQANLLPAKGQGSKVTLLSARTKDSYVNCTSPFAQPSTLYTREIIPPVPPEEPIGAEFATRPDFYGKSTYTFDVAVADNDTRSPFALVFYRANSRAILDTLYKPSTVQTILAALSNLSPEDAGFNNNRWKDLVNVQNLDGNGHFKAYVDGGFSFPDPDNSELELPDEVEWKNGSFHPFANPGTPPGAMVALVNRAIELAFVSLTERPVEYAAIRTEAENGGRITRKNKPVVKDSNGNFIFPPNPLYDPAPMAVKYADGNVKKVRFTDYTLEGSSNEIYFYFGKEISSDLKFSDRSPVAGPIRLVDAFPAAPPSIRRVLTQLADPVNEVPTGVRFEVDPYLSGERIKKYQLFRALDDVDASSIRSMKKVKEFVVDVHSTSEVVELVDTFDDQTPYPPYGDLLYYRVVALSEISNEAGLQEFVLSQPSSLVLANIVDIFNPEAPDITFNYIEDTSFPRKYTHVVLSWNKTVHNGVYYVYRMTSSGNYVKIGEVRSNDARVDFVLGEDLVKVDEDGEEVYYRFKVDVVNSSGLLNLQSKEFTI